MKIFEIASQNWKIGNHSSTVVSDGKIQNTNFPVPPNRTESDDSDVEYYGGFLICESVGNKETAKLIAASPKLYRSLRTLLEAGKKGFPEFLAAVDEAEKVIIELEKF